MWRARACVPIAIGLILLMPCSGARGQGAVVTVTDADNKSVKYRASSEWIVTYVLSTKPEGERFMSMGEVTNYDYHYRVAFAQVVQMDGDGLISVPDIPGTGSFSNRAKVRSKEGMEATSSVDAVGRVKGTARLVDNRFDVKLSWSLGPGSGVGPDGTQFSIPPPSMWQSSAWQLHPQRPQAGWTAERFGYQFAFHGRRNTTVDQGPAAPPMPVYEEIEIFPLVVSDLQAPAERGSSSERADIAVSLEAPPQATQNLKTALSVTVTNKGPGVAREAVLAVLLPGALQVLSRSGCEGAVGSLGQHCRFAAVAPGASAAVRFEVIPRLAHDLPIAAVVRSMTLDPDASNNRAEQTMAVAASPAGAKK